jgi:hypothetical protein
VTFLWFVTGAIAIAILVGWRRERAVSKRLDQLTQMYWELKYQHGELRQQLLRATGEETAPQAPPVTRSTEAIIPLSSLKR